MLRCFPAFLLFFSVSLSSVLGFCVYNEHSDQTRVYIFQIEGQEPSTSESSRFRANELSPGDKQCCHFSNRDCNDTRNPKSILKFGVKRTYPEHPGGSFDIDCPAGGFIVFSGDSGNPKIAVFNADRSSYDYRMEWHLDQYFVHYDDDKEVAARYLSINRTGTPRN